MITDGEPQEKLACLLFWKLQPFESISSLCAVSSWRDCRKKELLCQAQLCNINPMSERKPEVIVFTDGSCPKPHGPGGWAFIARAGKKEINKCGRAEKTTNQRMEVQACIEALKYLKMPCKVTVTTDSEYLQKGASIWSINWKKQGWKKKNYDTKQMEEVANKDLWIELDNLMQFHEVEFKWTRGHVGHPENELCDKLAGGQARLIINE